MTIKLTWRKTDAYYVFVKCEGIAKKDDLPDEYVCGDGAKFWFVPYTPQHIKLVFTRAEHGHVSSFPSTLHVGTALLHRQHTALIGYMTTAARRLAMLKESTKTAEIVTEEI